QVINYDKSRTFFSTNVSYEDRVVFYHALGVHSIENLERYAHTFISTLKRLYILVETTFLQGKSGKEWASSGLLQWLIWISWDGCIGYSNIQDVKALSRGFEKCCFKFMPRVCNNAAYAMVVSSWSATINCFWVEDIPLEVRKIATVDCRWLDPP
ncbi:hypothetical protein Goari_022827, partial [Gossypium aridum]|nr:hypothetical protein [Gossypium aridum]